ncbi:MAG: hypothetical protein IT195_14035 [Microthrixaceae bacterium]|nr:hypothetical protein [Microthrixaceae bacterium]
MDLETTSHPDSLHDDDEAAPACRGCGREIHTGQARYSTPAGVFCLRCYTRHSGIVLDAGAAASSAGSA